MADLAAVRAAILVKLNAVSNIGAVHDYERYAKKESEFRALFYDSTLKRINGWWFDRESTKELDWDIGAVRRIHTWKLIGFRGIDDVDASTKAFQIVVESLATALRSDRILGGLIEDTKDMNQSEGPSGFQVEKIEPVMFAGVLCYRCTARYITETIES